MVMLAHSGRKASDIPPETYLEHISEVRKRASNNSIEALAFYSGAQPDFGGFVDWASAFHDLGKLEEENQRVLQTQERGRLPLNHVDAGVAYLLSRNLIEPALAVYSHHLGLCCLPDEIAKEQCKQQNPEVNGLFRDPDIKSQTDRNLTTLIFRHLKEGSIPSSVPEVKSQLSGLERRLLLSCLVDGDHGDTARHYNEESTSVIVAPAWEKRLEALNRYVSELGTGDGPRDELRKGIFRACRDTADALYWACDSPVGSGKTTAVMAYLLQEAIRLKLRHIFVVLPYTNIVQQSVRVYREALTLEGETPEAVVAAHHHRTEFSTKELRYLTTLWNAPVIITTAVQFFETLGASETMRLRKLHQLPGSAVFIDEAHAAMPVYLWPFMWHQLKELAEKWTCRFVFGSGSLARFWENPRIFGEREKCRIPSMIPEEIRKASADFEEKRVQYKTQTKILNLDSLCNWITAYQCPRLIVMNTVQGAAVVARELRRRKIHTLHLSTALAPIHREVILEKVRSNLKDRSIKDWALVATSCVEAGVDVSFQIAFRERSKAASIVQIGGRVNRHGEQDAGVVWDFVIKDPLIPVHPEFKHSRDIVRDLFDKDMWSQDLTTLMTYALDEEIKREGQEEKIELLLRKERTGGYPEVNDLTHLIQANTRLVVIDKELQDKVRGRVKVGALELMNGSVQLWFKRIEWLALPLLHSEREIYGWNYPYDKDFLGVMEGLLEQIQINEEGCAII